MSFQSIHKTATKNAIKVFFVAVFLFLFLPNAQAFHDSEANGTTSEYAYNPANQLTGIIHKGSGGNTLATFAYTLDANGRRTKAVETINGNTRTVDYQYDATGKLTQEKAQEGIRITTTDYQYDKVGNRTRKTVNGVTTTYVYNANDQLISETTGSQTVTYQYDNNGNLTQKQTPQGTVTYTWNSDNKLTAINDPIKGISVTYRLDAEGRRIGKTVREGTITTETQYLVDPARPYSEIVQARTRIGNGAWMETLYLHTPDGVGDLIAQTTGTETAYVLQDGQGSSRLTVDTDGMIKEIITFDAFGNRIDGFGRTATDATELDHLYVGELYDAESGLYHLRARDYDPKIGRFTARDALFGAKRTPTSLNKYVYANSDPIGHIDPNGEMALAMSMGNAAMFTMATPVFFKIATYAIAATTVGISIHYLYREFCLWMEEIALESAAFPLTKEQERQKQAEYEIMKGLSQMPPDPRNDCSGLSQKIHHAQAVIDRYKAWDLKWHPGRHASKIEDWEKRLENLKKEHNKKCAK